MGYKSKWSNPNRPDSVFERAAAWPGKFMETQFNSMVGDKPMANENSGDFFSNAGKGIENFAAGSIGGANNWIAEGSEKLRGDDWMQKLLGMGQMILGNLGKIALPVLGMAPTALGNVSALVKSVFNGGKEQPTTLVADASTPSSNVTAPETVAVKPDATPYVRSTGQDRTVP
jgi:hypothetical protein